MQSSVARDDRERPVRARVEDVDRAGVHAERAATATDLGDLDPGHRLPPRLAEDLAATADDDLQLHLAEPVRGTGEAGVVAADSELDGCHERRVRGVEELRSRRARSSGSSRRCSAAWRRGGSRAERSPCRPRRSGGSGRLAGPPRARPRCGARGWAPFGRSARGSPGRRRSAPASRPRRASRPCGRSGRGRSGGRASPPSSRNRCSSAFGERCVDPVDAVQPGQGADPVGDRRPRAVLAERDLPVRGGEDLLVDAGHPVVLVELDLGAVGRRAGGACRRRGPAPRPSRSRGTPSRAEAARRGRSARGGPCAPSRRARSSAGEPRPRAASASRAAPA